MVCLISLNQLKSKFLNFKWRIQYRGRKIIFRLIWITVWSRGFSCLASYEFELQILKSMIKNTGFNIMDRNVMNENNFNQNNCSGFFNFESESFSDLALIGWIMPRSCLCWLNRLFIMSSLASLRYLSLVST